MKNHITNIAKALTSSVALITICLAAAMVHAAPVPLKMVNVSAPAYNCLFDPSCTIVVDDTTSPIPDGGVIFCGPVSTFFLQSRTYTGNAGALGAGLYVYEYRIDLTGKTCPGLETLVDGILDVSIDFGPNVPMDFDGSGKLSDVYVVTGGGVGSVAPSAALRDGSRVYLEFDVGNPDGLPFLLFPGQSTFFIGLVSTQPPTDVAANINDLCGSCVELNAISQESVGARAPKTNPFGMIQNLVVLVEGFNLESWLGLDNVVRKAHRRITLDLLKDAAELVRLDEPQDAAALLGFLLGKVQGSQGAWLQCDGATGINPAGLLYDNLATVLDVLEPGAQVPLFPPSPCLMSSTGIGPNGAGP